MKTYTNKFIALAFLVGVLALPILARADHNTPHTIQQIQAQIEALSARVRALQGSQVTIPVQQAGFGRDLYFGMRNDADVTDLQEFLTEQGLYSGPVTGNYFILTLQAVKKFQSKHGIEPTGYFGAQTRVVANKILSEIVGTVLPPQPQKPVLKIEPVSIDLKQSKSYTFAAQITNAAPNSRIYYFLQRPDGSFRYDDREEIFNLGFVGVTNKYTDSDGNWSDNSISQLLNPDTQVGRWKSWVKIVGIESNYIYHTVVKDDSSSGPEPVTDTRTSGRDNRRITDIKQLQLALEIYYDARGSYPLSLGSLAPTYISTVPLDPFDGVSYSYVSAPDGKGCDGTRLAPCKNYHLGATLESVSHKALFSDGDQNSSLNTLNTKEGFNGNDSSSCGLIRVGYCYDVSAVPITVVNPFIQAARPVIDDIFVNYGTQGSIVGVVIRGKNFSGSEAYSANGISPVEDRGLKLIYSKKISDTQIEATFEIADNATPGDRYITVTTPSGTSLSRVFTVLTKARSISLVSDKFSGFAPLAVEFKATLNNFLSCGNTIQWTFGDGQGIGLSEACATPVTTLARRTVSTIHDFTSAGVYKVTLKVDSTTSNTVTVTVFQPVALSCSDLLVTKKSSFDACKAIGFENACFDKYSGAYQGCSKDGFNDCTINNLNADKNILCPVGKGEPLSVLYPKAGDRLSFGIQQRIRWSDPSYFNKQYQIHIIDVNGNTAGVAGSTYNTTEFVWPVGEASLLGQPRTLSPGSYRVKVIREDSSGYAEALSGFFEVVSPYPGFFMNTDKQSYWLTDTVVLAVSRADGKVGPAYVDLYSMKIGQESNKILLRRYWLVDTVASHSIALNPIALYRDGGAGQYYLLLCAAGSSCGSGETNSVLFDIVR